MKIFNLVKIIFAATLLASCGKDHSIGSNPTTTAEATSFKNVKYGSDPLQDMDVYLPGGRSTTSTKVIVMIHGGSWSSGDKTELDQFVDSLKRRLPDYAIFNINYRLSAAPLNTFPTQENDVKAAMNFIFNKKTEYAVSDRWVLMGVSAGGHLALLQGYKYNTPVVPKAIVSYSGPTDLNDMFTNPAGGNPLISALMASVIGKSPAQDPQLYITSSPVTYISATSPPTLLLHGDVDPLVSPQQPALARAKLQAAGVTNQYVLYNGTAHIDTWSNAVLFDAFNKTAAFLKANVN